VKVSSEVGIIFIRIDYAEEEEDDEEGLQVCESHWTLCPVPSPGGRPGRRGRISWFVDRAEDCIKAPLFATLSSPRSRHGTNLLMLESVTPPRGHRKYTKSRTVRMIDSGPASKAGLGGGF